MREIDFVVIEEKERSLSFDKAGFWNHFHPRISMSDDVGGLEKMLLNSLAQEVVVVHLLHTIDAVGNFRALTWCAILARSRFSGKRKEWGDSEG